MANYPSAGSRSTSQFNSPQSASSSDRSFRNINPGHAPILLLSLTSPTLLLSKVHECGDMLSQQISQIDGVAQVSVFGGQKYAVRVQVDPAAIAARNISLDDIARSACVSRFHLVRAFWRSSAAPSCGCWPRCSLPNFPTISMPA